MNKVLITTSGTGSRLGNLTKYTNKCLIRVGKKPAISHILDSYPKDTQFVVTLGYYGNHVKQYINIAHKNLNIQVVDVDKFEGEGSSLLYSMFCAKQYLNCPFIYHACDSIVNKNLNEIYLNTNWIGGHPSRSSFHYRTFNVNRNQVCKLNDKGEKNSDYDYIGVCGIVDHEEFWDVSKNLLNTNKILSDYDVIDYMIKDGIYFDSKIYSYWKDIGNIDSLKEARKTIDDQFNILDKDDESIFILNDKVIKFFNNTKVCKDRVIRGKKLYPLVPKIIDSSDNFYSYEYMSGQVLSKSITTNKMKKLLSWAETNMWKQVPDDSLYEKRCIDFYKNKTKDRINNFLKLNYKKEKAEFINQELIPPVMEMLDMINYESLSSKNPSIFHGDFILENILETSTDFILLDWRQNFADTVEYGDFHYDLAKLNHNLTLDHSVIYSNQYECTESKEGIKCQILVPSINIECKEILKTYCKNKNINYSNINILTSLIWLSMSSLHEHPLDKFLYYFGRYNLFLHLLKK